MNIKEIREWINLRIYPSKVQVLKRLNLASLFVSLFSILLIVYFYGFKHTTEETEQLFIIVQGSFAFYIFRYFLRLFYDFSPFQFIRKHWFEGILITLLITDAISYNFSGKLIIQQTFQSLGFENFTGISNLFLQVYILIMVGVELKTEYSVLPKFKTNPANVFLFTFLLLISAGTGLLMLPEMTTVKGSMPFIDALFTATSASCVTGLIVVDTGTFFTFKGHVVILLLMKLGGLNIITFGAFSAFFAKLGVKMKHHSVVEDFTFNENIFSSRGLLAKIIVGSLLFEFIGAFILYWLSISKGIVENTGDAFFFSLFHSVSAFNNAGFSTLTNGLLHAQLSTFYFFHIIIAILIIFGALGFTTFFDLFSIENMRDRLKYPWKRPRLGSLLNLYSTVILILVGTVAFFAFEYNGVLVDKNTLHSGITAFFQSVTLRTAGFSSVDFGQLSLPFLSIAILLMFIGGSSGSTAGGIKTSTFTIMILSAYATLRGKKNIEVFHRSISQDIVFRAISVFFFSISGIAIGTFLLTISETDILDNPKWNFMDLMFENVSAFSTVGISTGITGNLSSAGKLIIILSMFVGRVGTLTIGFALSRKISSTNYKYPSEHMLVG